MRRFASIFTLAAAAAFASADFIDFESDPVGSKPNGWMSASSANVAFSDTNGANMDVANAGSETIGQGLRIFGDDPSMLEMVFSGTFTNLSLVFGNDDPGFSNPGDLAVLRTYSGATLLNTVSVVMNRDDAGNQTIFSVGTFDRATFSYENSSFQPINLIEVVDNVSFESVPEPGTMAVLGFGALAMLRRRRKA